MRVFEQRVTSELGGCHPQVRKYEMEKQLCNPTQEEEEWMVPPAIMDLDEISVLV